jgi:WD40 repeat protein
MEPLAQAWALRSWLQPSPTYLFQVPESQVFHVAFTPDGRHAVSGGSDEVLHVWNVRTGADHGAGGQPKRGCIWSLSVSPCGQFAVTGSDSGALAFWQLPR